MAEISVPAWPIPIHQTKFVMAQPQHTGMRMPQMPTPLANSNRHYQPENAQQRQARRNAAVPQQRHLAREHYGRDLIGDDTERIAGADDVLCGLGLPV